jgi:hypothetical protein
MTQPTADPRRGHRQEDTSTSIQAAAKVRKTSEASIAAVRDLMRDGVPRIDQEIENGCRQRGHCKSLSSAQHGRLVLQEVGILVKTGVKRNTKDGSPSNEWVIDPAADAYIEAHGISHLNMVPTVSKPSFKVMGEALDYLIPAAKYFAMEGGEELPKSVKKTIAYLRWDVVRRKLRSEA